MTKEAAQKPPNARNTPDGQKSSVPIPNKHSPTMKDILKPKRRRIHPAYVRGPSPYALSRVSPRDRVNKFSNSLNLPVKRDLKSSAL
jgi:hypothetical protein